MSRQAYTLMETIITVAIIAILAAVGIPQYTKTRNTGYRRAARDVLQAIYAGEQVYGVINRDPATGQNRYLVSLTPGSPDAEWQKLYVDNPNRLASLPLKVYITVGSTGVDTSFRAYGRLIPTFNSAANTGNIVCVSVSDTGVQCPGNAACPVAPPALALPCTKWWTNP